MSRLGRRSSIRVVAGARRGGRANALLVTNLFPAWSPTTPRPSSAASSTSSSRTARNSRQRCPSRRGRPPCRLLDPNRTPPHHSVGAEAEPTWSSGERPYSCGVNPHRECLAPCAPLGNVVLSRDDGALVCDASGRYVPLACTGDETCPARHVCREGTCRVRTCATSSDCDGRFCVNGLCYDEPGRCYPCCPPQLAGVADRTAGSSDAVRFVGARASGNADPALTRPRPTDRTRPPRSAPCRSRS